MLTKLRKADYPAFRRALKAAHEEFYPWYRAIPTEDYVALIGDLWEVSYRRGRAKGSRPTTLEEAAKYLSQSWHSDAEFFALILLWRRHARGRRYVSAFGKDNHDNDAH